MSIEEMWEAIVNYGIATDDEIRLVTSINGHNEQAMFDIVYARTGLRNFEQLEDEFE